MKFEKGDKVRIKKSKALEKLYGNHSHECWSTCKDIIMDVDVSEVRCAKSGVWVNGALQLILESPKLTLRLSQSGLKLKIKILHQDESLRDNLEIDYEKYCLISDAFPELIDGIVICVKGSSYDCDNYKISYTYSSQSELDSFVSVLRVMMKDDVLQ